MERYWRDFTCLIKLVSLVIFDYTEEKKRG